MAHSEGERPGDDRFPEDPFSLSPRAQPRVTELALQAFLEEALRGRRLGVRHDFFKAFQSATAYSGSIDVDPAEQ